MGDSIQETSGLVKWFDPKKGFGFIVGPNGQDIFIHYTQIDGDGFRVLRDGERVIYDAVRTPGRGWHATRAKRAEDQAEYEVQVRRAKPETPSESHARSSRHDQD